jgi:hypothetical protein
MCFLLIVCEELQWSKHAQKKKRILKKRKSVESQVLLEDISRCLRSIANGQSLQSPRLWVSGCDRYCRFQEHVAPELHMRHGEFDILTAERRTIQVSNMIKHLDIEYFDIFDIRCRHTFTPVSSCFNEDASSFRPWNLIMCPKKACPLVKICFQ